MGGWVLCVGCGRSHVIVLPQNAQFQAQYETFLGMLPIFVSKPATFITASDTNALSSVAITDPIRLVSLDCDQILVKKYFYLS